MMWSEVISLITPGRTYKDKYGQTREGRPKKRDVFANPWKVTEPYKHAAGVTDLRNVTRMQIHSFEYAGEELFEWQGRTYRVASVETRGERVILLGEERIGNVKPSKTRS